MTDHSLKILLVEKNEEECRILRDLLAGISAGTLQVDCICQYDRAFAEICKDLHDVYFVASDLGERSGVELLRQVGPKEIKKPVILLTHPDMAGCGHAEPSQLGATECLSKEDIGSAPLEHAIHSALKQRQTRKALKKSAERLHFLAESTGDVLYRLSYETMTYEYLSPVIEKMTGYSVTEIDELGFSSLVGRIDLPDRQDVTREALMADRLKEETGEYRADYLIRKKSGELRWLRDHSFPWYDETGRLAGSTGILSDVTELKETEECLRNSERELRCLSSNLLTLLEEERERLARTLHDSFGQTLIAIKYAVEVAIRAAETGDDKAVQKSLEPIIPMIQRGTEEVRQLYMSLRPTVLDDFGVLAAIDWYAREFEKLSTNIRIEKHALLDEGDVPKHLKIIIYRIMQEAVESSAKFGQATQIIITLKALDHGIELTVEDNGRGFDPQEKELAGSQEYALGLASMKERAKLSGGSLQVSPGKHAGTVIKASWPTT